MSYSSFHSIPAEAVVSDEAAWEVINKTLKCPDNKEICEGCMDIAKVNYANDPNPYKAQAYRRAAIVVANVDYPLISEKGRESVLRSLRNQIGLPPCGSTTMFISDCIKHGLLTNKLQKNIYEAFPPEWRKGLLADDERINIALEVLDAFINHSVMSQIYPNSVLFPEKRVAYQFYVHFNNSERNILRDHIEDFVMEACC